MAQVDNQEDTALAAELFSAERRAWKFNASSRRYERVLLLYIRDAHMDREAVQAAAYAEGGIVTQARALLKAQGLEESKFTVDLGTPQGQEAKLHVSIEPAAFECITHIAVPATTEGVIYRCREASNDPGNAVEIPHWRISPPERRVDRTKSYVSKPDAEVTDADRDAVLKQALLHDLSLWKDGECNGKPYKQMIIDLNARSLQQKRGDNGEQTVRIFAPFDDAQKELCRAAVERIFASLSMSPEFNLAVGQTSTYERLRHDHATHLEHAFGADDFYRKFPKLVVSIPAEEFDAKRGKLVDAYRAFKRSAIESAPQHGAVR